MLSKSFRCAEGVISSSRSLVPVASRLRHTSLVASSRPSVLAPLPSQSRSIIFFSRHPNRRSSPSPTEESSRLRESLHHAVNSQDSQAIYVNYKAFRKYLLAASPDERSRLVAQSQIDRNFMFQAVRSLLNRSAAVPSSSPHPFMRQLPQALDPRVVQLARQMYFDTSEIFGLRPSNPVQPAVLEAMAATNPQSAFDWIIAADADPSAASAPFSENDYVIVAKGFSATGDEAGVRKVIDRLRTRPNLSISEAVYRPLMTLATGPDFFTQSDDLPRDRIEALEALFEEMWEKDRLRPSLYVLDILTRTFDSHPACSDLAEQYAASLKIALEARQPPYSETEGAFASALLVERACAKGGYTAGVREAKDLVKQGIQVTSHGVRSLLTAEDAPIHNENSLRILLRDLDVESAQIIWSIAVRVAIKRGGKNGLRAAQALYAGSKRDGHSTDAEMADPLIHALVHQHRFPSVTDMEAALEIYYDYRDSRMAIPRESRPRPEGREAQLYMVLLNAILVLEPKNSTTEDILIQLLIDIRENGVQFTADYTKTMFKQLLLFADSYKQAHELYTHFREINPAILDSPTYLEILEAFSSLSFPTSPLPSTSLYSSIVRDMRESGITIVPLVYTLLYKRYTRAAPSRRDNGAPARERRQEIYSAIKRAHLEMKVDASVTPDIETMNALMNAYNFIGAYGDALDVWQQLELGQPRFDAVSVSIVLDACGFMGNEALARSVWRRVVRERDQMLARGTASSSPSRGLTREALRGMAARRTTLVPNVKNYAAWIECLGRFKDYDGAFAAFREMVDAKEGGLIPKPDEVCAEMLQTWARKFNRLAELEEYMKRETPELHLKLVWSSRIPDVINNIEAG